MSISKKLEPNLEIAGMRSTLGETKPRWTK